MSYGTANNLIHRFEDAGILEEVTGRQRYRRYRYGDYVELFTEREDGPMDVETMTTETTPD